MYLAFLRYFFRYLLLSKTRQRLLILAVVGLILSSFALLVLQSTMGGLQKGRINRSKAVLGAGVIELQTVDRALREKIFEKISKKYPKAVKELEEEMIIKGPENVSGAVVHAINDHGPFPQFLKDQDLTGMVVPPELSFRIGANRYDSVVLYSPTRFDSLFQDIPRYGSGVVTGQPFTGDLELDGVHLWVRLRFLQNALRERSFNRIRFYGSFDKEEIQKDLSDYPALNVVSWEDQNQSLVWSLALESRVMILLFVGMSFLVSLCITSGLLIFFSKIKNDLSSFWILGASKRKLENACSLFLNTMGLSAVCTGLLLGLAFLQLYQVYGGEIMPDVFVDRKIPILITTKGLLVSFCVPFIVSWLFSRIGLAQFKREENFLEQIRGNIL